VPARVDPFRIEFLREAIRLIDTISLTQWNFARVVYAQILVRTAQRG